MTTSGGVGCSRKKLASGTLNTCRGKHLLMVWVVQGKSWLVEPSILAGEKHHGRPQYGTERELRRGGTE